MATEVKQTCYDGSCIQNFQFYLEHSGEHQAIEKFTQDVLLGEFKRVGAGRSSLDVLGVGSGGGQVDVQMLAVLQSAFPSVPVTADVLEGSRPLTDNFKALIAKTPSLQKIPFVFHIMKSEEYETQVKAKADVKTFDFIHMIQMIYYVEDLAGTIKFFHSLLKANGRLMIIVEAAGGGWDILWKTFKEELCTDAITDYRSSAEVVACVKSLGLKCEEHAIPNAFDVSQCFDPGSQSGSRLLNFMTAQENFHQSFSPEVRAEILDLLKTKCSTKAGGRIMFDSSLVAVLIHA